MSVWSQEPLANRNKSIIEIDLNNNGNSLFDSFGSFYPLLLISTGQESIKRDIKQNKEDIRSSISSTGIQTSNRCTKI